MIKLAVLPVAIVLTGCAGHVEYTPPVNNHKFERSVTVSASKDTVWKTLIPNLGKEFFVINNLDKESGLINVSYSGDPESYIDCGYISSKVQNAAGKRSYYFPAATANKSYEVMENGNYAQIHRKMNLEGRINIIVEALSGTETAISANTKYVVTKSGVISIPYPRQSHNFTDSISFNTGSSATFPNSKMQGTTCYSTGKLEKSILSLIPANRI